MENNAQGQDWILLTLREILKKAIKIYTHNETRGRVFLCHIQIFNLCKNLNREYLMRESKADDRLLRNLNGLLALIHFKLHLQTYILIRAPMSHHDSESEKKNFKYWGIQKISLSAYLLHLFLWLFESSISCWKETIEEVNFCQGTMQIISFSRGKILWIYSTIVHFDLKACVTSLQIFSFQFVYPNINFRNI